MKTKALHAAIVSHLLSTVALFLAIAPGWKLSSGWAAAAEEVTGEWELKMDFSGREVFGTVCFSRGPDGALTGKWGGEDLSDVKFDGQKLTFVRTVKMGNEEIRASYEGTLKDGNLVGTLSSDRGSIAANGARRKTRCPALGSWSVKYRIRDRDVSATLAVSQKQDGALEGKWTSDFGEHVISDLKFQDGKLSFARKTKAGEREWESTYAGTVEGDKLTGTIVSQMGEVAANGERVGAGLIGKWEATSTSERGTITSTLNFYGDLTGRYELFGGEIPIDGITLEGDQVTFNIEMGFGGQPFKMEFKGKLEGSTLKGSLTTPRGTSDVSAKKVSPASLLVGTWEITREGSQGTRTSTLAIKEDMTGTYTVRDNTVPVTDLKLEGDQVSFKVTLKYGEREVPMEFKGKVDGTSLAGAFTSSRGTREAKGKKVGAAP